MLGTTIWASLQQNLFTEFSLSGSPMVYGDSCGLLYKSDYSLVLGRLVGKESPYKINMAYSFRLFWEYGNLRLYNYETHSK